MCNYIIICNYMYYITRDKICLKIFLLPLGIIFTPIIVINNNNKLLNLFFYQKHINAQIIKIVICFKHLIE